MMRSSVKMLVIISLLLLASRACLGADVSVLGGLTREVTLEPGTQHEGRILLRNNTPEPLEVKLYQTDYHFEADGENSYGEPGTAPRSNAAWITVTPAHFVIPKGDTSPVHYSISVPDDGGALSGTYWSMLMVEPVGDDMLDPAVPNPDKHTVAVRTVMRYGIQMITQIGQSGTRDMKFADKRLVIEGSERTLQIDIENTGERVLRPTVWAELYHAEGTSIGRFSGGRLRIYPACSARYNIELWQLPPGLYRALVVADNGDDHVFGAQWKLQIR